MKILIAGTDDTSRVNLKRLFAAYGPSHTAITGRQALEAYRFAKRQDQPYDLICLDLLMSEMNGHEVLTTIRGMESRMDVPQAERVKVVLTATKDDPESILSAFRPDCEGYLVQPVDRGTLREVMDSLGFEGKSGTAPSRREQPGETA